VTGGHSLAFLRRKEAPVKITLLSEDAIRLEPMPGQLTIEAESADQDYSPYQMLGSSLAVCAFGVLQSWASNVGVSSDDLVIDVSWSFAEKPHRVGSIDLSFRWPSLPPDRRATAERVAALCPVHKTFTQTPSMTIRVAA
jgi:uncharacterized OsmC-like protein